MIYFFLMYIDYIRVFLLYRIFQCVVLANSDKRCVCVCVCHFTKYSCHFLCKPHHHVLLSELVLNRQTHYGIIHFRIHREL